MLQLTVGIPTSGSNDFFFSFFLGGLEAIYVNNANPFCALYLPFTGSRQSGLQLKVSCVTRFPLRSPLLFIFLCATKEGDSHHFLTRSR